MSKGLSILWIIIIIVLVLGAIGGGYYVYRSYYAPNAKICCLPECKEMTRQKCLESNGWVRKKCKCSVATPSTTTTTTPTSTTGFTATAEAEQKGLAAAEGTAEYIFTINMETCAAKVTEAEWTGEWDWVWTYRTAAGAHQDPAEDEIEFTTDKDGKFSVIIGNTPAQGEITQDTFTIEYEMPGIAGHVEATGPVTAGGTTTCQKK